MNRRSALRNFMILSAGVALLPSCKDEKVKGIVSLKNMQLSGDQENMLANLSSTILPVKTEAPADAAHYFVLAMVDDCYPRQDQQKFMQGLEAFDKLAQQQFNKPFVECSGEQKNKLLTEMEKGGDESVHYFYNTTRSLTLQYYTTSKYYLVNVRKFEMAPGRFRGCFPVDKKSV